MAATAVGTFTATRSALNPLSCPSLPQKPDPFYISIPVFPTPNPPWNPLWHLSWRSSCYRQFALSLQVTSFAKYQAQNQRDGTAPYVVLLVPGMPFWYSHYLGSTERKTCRKLSEWQVGVFNVLLACADLTVFIFDRVHFLFSLVMI